MIHLHLHSHYSVLDGLGKVEEIVKRAFELRMPSIAITDHTSISAMPELFRHAAVYNIKPIIGSEFYLVDKLEPDKNEKRYHLLVIAKSWRGVQSIMRQLTLANQQYYKRPRLSIEQALEFHDCIVSTACSSGILSHENYVDLVSKFFDRYREDFYLEVMPLSFEINEEKTSEGTDCQKIVNQKALILNRHTGIKLLATNDAHYVRQEDYLTHDILLAIQTGKKLSDVDRWSFGTSDLYIKSTEEMVAAFKDLKYFPPDKIKEAIINTYEVADKINIEIPKFNISLPNPFLEDDELMFNKIIRDGYRTKILDKIPKTEQQKYIERLGYEISVIKTLGFVRYFLIVHDIVSWAKKQGIMVGCGRGSAAGSLVCYLMDITQIDPLKFELYFERFLNPERIDYPDIDIDFEDNRRDEVFRYIKDKYNYTAHINTFGYMKLKQTFQDVCRVYGINYLESVNLSKQLEEINDFETNTDLKRFASKHPHIVEQVKKLTDTIRQQGMHAAGIIISNSPITDVAVLERRKDDAVVCNWDKRECERFGLVKVDILGLSTLTILNDAKRLIKERHDQNFEYEKLPLDDKKTFEAFAKGEGVGVFQFENVGMRNLLKQIQARDFETVTVTTALFRPGSLHSGQTEKYIRIVNGYDYENYPIPAMRPILETTKSILVYQEQIMRIFVDLAGFSWAEADKMRKIISKTLGREEFEKHRQHFVEGCTANGYDPTLANDIFDKMVEFALYSFNKSHAVAYTMISYWNMYIKVHYPLEFFASLLTYSGKDDKIKSYIKEAQRLGIKIKLPDINLSTNAFYIDGDTLIAPFNVIKGVGQSAINEIIESRKKVGVFVDFSHFFNNVNKRKVDRTKIEILKRAGCFESFGLVEVDKNIDIKNKTELISIFDSISSIQLKEMDIDFDILEIFYRNISTILPYPLLKPKTGRKPILMVINNAQKNEQDNLTAEGTKYLLKMFKKHLGITPNKVYYTNYIKYVMSDEERDNIFKKHPSLFKDIIKKEIQIIKPNFILCCVSDLVQFFSKEKANIKDINGTIIYNSDFNCFVMFSVSPQWAFFEKNIDRLFEENIKKLSETINFP